MEEYTQRLQALGDLTGGMGLETHTNMPCPWCASPGFMLVRVVNARTDLAQEATCERCGRSGLNLNIDWDTGGTSGEFVQTGGPDSPEWLQPAPRRIEREAT
jgi:predicted RNA-binding Zn-ribbon protein involved in translation (DUF1610 family)